MISQFVQEPETMPAEAVVFGRSPAMRALRSMLIKGAHANVPVLIYGESGSGKDLLARIIHRWSGWSSGPFYRINCSSTGADAFHGVLKENGHLVPFSRPSERENELLCRATLLLDDLADLSLRAQSKLLESLHDGYCHLVSHGDTPVIARLICSTSRHLEPEVARGAFRQDLFYRLNVISLRVPSLRERAEDIPDLVEYFLETFGRRYGARPPRLSDPGLSFLMGYSWPGNVRELENVIQRYVILGSEDVIYNELAPAPAQTVTVPMFSADRPISLKAITRTAVRDVERQVILKILQANHWNRRRTARLLNISYRALLYKMKDVAIVPPRNDGNGAGPQDQ